MHVSFTRGSAFLLLAENVNTYQIDEAERIDKAILHLYDHEKWLEHWIVVSEVSLGAPVITVVAGDRGGAATVDLGASAGAGAFSLADAGADLRLGYTKDLQASFVTRGRSAVLWRGRYVRDPVVGRRRMSARGSSDGSGVSAGAPAIAALEYLSDIGGWPGDPA